ncbi:MAG TPA: ABC transporter substrate-binding protein [Pyrinomonadaceae bacterium]|jgi:peptide/nickel transport system substrate-binding protein
MRTRFFVSILLVLILTALLFAGCRNKGNAFVIVLSGNISSLDPILSQDVPASNERVRVLMFNSLVRKNEKFEYVNELASEMPKVSDDGLTVTFTLRDNVKFQDGRALTSADAKYTMDTLLASSSRKAASFYEVVNGQKQPYITSVEAPDARTLVLRMRKPWLQLLPNLVPIGIIPKDSSGQQTTQPLGSGPFRFKSFDKDQQVLELEANPNYWEGAPNIQNLRVRVIADTNALQAELRSGRVDLAPLPTNLTPDAINSLGQDPNLKVEQFPGANIYHITINTQSAPLDNVRVRQAIAYAIDREEIIRTLLRGQAKLAHSILPEESWAYSQGVKYSYNPEQAKKLLDEAGFRDPDGDGPQMRFPKPISFKFSSASTLANQYGNVIADQLKRVGIPIQIETAEANTLLEQLRAGQFQMTTGNWVGGNQDPSFFNDLFATSRIPTGNLPTLNRSRYSDPELDRKLEEALNTADQAKAKVLYARVQDIVSRDVPLLPLWYLSNMVIARKNVGNIKVDGSGDWAFVRSLTVEK